MATLVVTSVGLLFSLPGAAAQIKADKASVERVAIVASNDVARQPDD